MQYYAAPLCAILKGTDTVSNMWEPPHCPRRKWKSCTREFIHIKTTKVSVQARATWILLKSPNLTRPTLSLLGFFFPQSIITILLALSKMSSTTLTLGPQPTVPYSQCTLDLCPVELAQIPYAPTLAGNSLYLAIFSAALATNLVLGVWYRTWGYLVGMALGCLLEILGYVGRLKMHFNPFPEDPFLL